MTYSTVLKDEARARVMKTKQEPYTTSITQIFQKPMARAYGKDALRNIFSWWSRKSERLQPVMSGEMVLDGKVNVDVGSLAQVIADKGDHVTECDDLLQLTGQSVKEEDVFAMSLVILQDHPVMIVSMKVRVRQRREKGEVKEIDGGCKVDGGLGARGKAEEAYLVDVEVRYILQTAPSKSVARRHRPHKSMKKERWGYSGYSKDDISVKDVVEVEGKCSNGVMKNNLTKDVVERMHDIGLHLGICFAK
ncbi:hypothetical protein VNO78_13485 [Psophocarpus tetragonolobus]|uniref:Uncharacterized protein n=1 Tax=Psophocarpus tetragonolobus TaxID=3891 RepID=A0AAN9XPW5_PSOTE